MSDKLRKLASALDMTIPQIFSYVASINLNCDYCPLADKCDLEDYDSEPCYDLWMKYLEGEDLNG